MTLKSGAATVAVLSIALSTAFVGKVALDDTPKTVVCWTCANGVCKERRTTLIRRPGEPAVWMTKAAALQSEVSNEPGDCLEVGQPSTWAKLTEDFDVAPQEQPPSCACQATAGPPCLFTNGGPIDRTAMPGEFIPSAGCAPRLCGGPAGSDPIPPECRGTP